MTDEQIAYATFVGTFAFLLPVAIVWWRERRKRRRLAEAYAAAHATPGDMPLDALRGFLSPKAGPPLDGSPQPIAPRPLPMRPRVTRVVSEEASPPFTGPKRWDPKAYSASDRPTRPERRSSWQSSSGGARSSSARPAMALPSPASRPSDDDDDDLWLKRSLDLPQPPTFPFGCDPFESIPSEADALSTPLPTPVAVESGMEGGGGQFGGAGASGSWDDAVDAPSPPSSTDP